MKKLLIYIIPLFLWKCDALLEITSPLGGVFYIEDGWQEFTSENYDKANQHFNTAIESSDSGSVEHFLSFVGLGWTNIYKAQSIQEVTENGLVKAAGEYFDSAYLLSGEIPDEQVANNYQEDYSNGKNDLAAGLAIQRAYHVKQKVANQSGWESYNFELNENIVKLLEESISYSRLLTDDFVFQYDSSFVFNNILILRIESYVLLGDLEKAVTEFTQINFEQLDFELMEECEQSIDTEIIVECLCAAANEGNCPFED